VLLVALGACSGGGGTTTTTDPLIPSAIEFAHSADRALDGTRFSTVETVDLAAAIVALCRGVGDPAIALPAAIAGLDAPAGDAGDDVILAEVLLTGIAAVCPERSGDATAAYVTEVTAAASSTGGAVIGESTALSAGLAACDALDAGDPEDALVAIAAVGFGVEASLEQLLGGALSESEAVTVGAILSASAAHLCPEHEARVAEFVNDLAS
jgi:hypothetical protein